MVSANKEMVVYCFDTLVAHYNNDQVPPPDFEEGEQIIALQNVHQFDLLLDFASVITLQGSLKKICLICRSILQFYNCNPLFVTWKKALNGGEPRLRGCIGTLEARGLINGFRDYALTSALRDRRFPPIQAKELPQLECTVSILTDYETASNYLDWEVGKHGIIIEFTDPDYNTKRSATYLPEVAAHEGWTVIEAIDSLMRKAGYNGVITESLRKRIQLTRYQSALCTMHYSEYVSYVRTKRGAAPAIGGCKG